FGGVEAFDLPALHRALLDRGGEHSGQLEIGAVDLLAGNLVHGVEALDALAGDLPILRILERDVLRRLDLGGGFRHFAVGWGAAGRRVRDHAVRCAPLGPRDFPVVGGGLFEHLAGRRAAFAHIFVRGADAAAAAGREVTPYPLARDALAGRGIFGCD